MGRWWELQGVATLLLIGCLFCCMMVGMGSMRDAHANAEIIATLCWLGGLVCGCNMCCDAAICTKQMGRCRVKRLCQLSPHMADAFQTITHTNGCHDVAMHAVMANDTPWHTETMSQLRWGMHVNNTPCVPTLTEKTVHNLKSW